MHAPAAHRRGRAPGVVYELNGRVNRRHSRCNRRRKRADAGLGVAEQVRGGVQLCLYHIDAYS